MRPMQAGAKTRTLPGTEEFVGHLALGTMTFGDQVEEAQAVEMVDRCRAVGVTLFDTSVNYQGGASEEILGRIVRSFRDDVQLATKIGGLGPEAPEHLRGLKPSAIREGIDISLRRLGTSYVDLYFFHRPDRTTRIEASLEAADGLVRSGKVRALGLSNFAAWEIVHATAICEREGWAVPEVMQQQYNLVSRRLETEYAEAADRFAWATIVYNPLAGGLLTGKHRFGRPPGSGQRFARDNYRRRYWHEEMFQAIDDLRDIAADAGLTLVELALRWLSDRPVTSGILLGASSLGQLEENLAALDGPPLDASTRVRCDEVWERLRGRAPDYNR